MVNKLQSAATVIILDNGPEPAVYTDDVHVGHNPLWLHQYITIRSVNTTVQRLPSLYPALNLQAIFSPASVMNNQFHIQLQYLKLSGVIEAGDVHLFLTHCLVDGLSVKESLHIRPVRLNPVFHFEFSQFENFVINYKHEDKSEGPLLVNTIRFQSISCVFKNFSIRLQGNATNTIILDSIFDGYEQGSFLLENLVPSNELPGAVSEHQPLDIEVQYDMQLRPTPPTHHTDTIISREPMTFSSSLHVINSIFRNGEIGLDTFSSNESNMDISVRDSLFKNLRKGFTCKAQGNGAVKVYFLNTTFADIINTGHGGALSIQVSNFQSSVKISNSTFKRNTARTRMRREVKVMEKDEPGRGGAIAIGARELTTKVSDRSIIYLIIDVNKFC